MLEAKFDFLKTVHQALEQKGFIQLTLSKPANSEVAFKSVLIKTFMSKQQEKIQSVTSFPTRDITKNLTIDETLALLKQLVGDQLLNAHLFTTTNDWEMRYNRKRVARIWKKKPSKKKGSEQHHDHQKKQWITAENNIYLKELGVTSANGKVLDKKYDKFRQINKYIETISHLLDVDSLRNGYRIVDMGSGKGYLTFALYDYLSNTLNITPKITGVELRGELVDRCNEISNEAGFSGLAFRTGRIEDYPTTPMDMLIALHACDIATDQAIAKGIASGAAVIVCAPCCHKQVRIDMKGSKLFHPMLKHGILLERQAEMLTDAIRSLLLEANGYKTKVFEFISTDHTGKNVMITAVKHPKARDRAAVLHEIAMLKEQFGLKTHHLETLV